MDGLLRTDKLITLMDKTENGCDKNCQNCDLWLSADKMCYHEWHRKWKAWNEAEHKRFGEILK